jgi:hypothetical protein
MSPDWVFHLSEEPGLPSFSPRSTSGTPGEHVWAISNDRLHNYLVPRECPRVTFYSSPDTTAADRARYLPGPHVSAVAIERAWLPRLLSTTLYAYVFDASDFVRHDPIAGYYVCDHTVEPLLELTIDQPHISLLARGIELRVLDDLTALRDAVVASSLGFSIIRWRNARAQGP